MKCRQCYQEKEPTEFKKKWEGRDTICKRCYNINDLEYVRKYRQTPKGWINTSWQRMNQRANNKDGNHPTYIGVEVRMTQNEFAAWGIIQLEKWRKTHSLEEMPTIDRIDSNGHYEINNIQLLSKRDNSRKRNNNPLNAESLAKYIFRQSQRLNISLEKIIELIEKEQKNHLLREVVQKDNK